MKNWKIKLIKNKGVNNGLRYLNFKRHEYDIDIFLTEENSHNEIVIAVLDDSGSYNEYIETDNFLDEDIDSWLDDIPYKVPPVNSLLRHLEKVNPYEDF